MRTASLVLEVASSGIAKANEQQLRLIENAERLEKTRDRLASSSEKSIDREWQAYQRAEARKEALDNKRRQTEERDFARRQAAYEKQWRAAEAAHAREVASAEKAARREEEAWVNAIQRAKARAEREGWGRDGVLPIRPSLQRIEAQQSRFSAAFAGAQQGAASSLGLGVLAGGIAGVTAAGVTAAIGGIKSLAHEMVALNDRYEDTIAVLGTVSNSLDDAKEKYQAIQGVQSEALFGAEALAKAYIQLTNAGLNPTKRELEAFSNIAAGTGASLDTVATAVQQAAQGLSRGLRQFGIGATVEGENIKLTFRGITTTVKNDAASIEEYMVHLGETAFGDATKRKLETISGQFKVLSSAFEELGRASIRAASGKGGKTPIASVAEDVEDLAKTVDKNKGAIDKLIQIAVIAGKYTLATVAAPVVAAVAAKRIIDRSTGSDISPELQSRMWGGISEAAMSSETDVLAQSVDKQREIREAAAAQELAELRQKHRSRQEIAFEEYQKELKIIEKGTKEGSQEREDEIAKLNLRIEQQVKEGDIKDNALVKKAASEALVRFKAFQKAVAEVDPIAKANAEFAERQKWIDMFVKKSSAKYAELSLANQRQRDADAAKVIDAADAEYTSLVASLKNQEEAFQISYEKRKKIIDQNAENEEERARHTAALRAELDKQVFALRESKIQERQALMEPLTVNRPEIQAEWQLRAQLRKIEASNFPQSSSLDPFEGPSKDELAEAAKRNHANQIWQISGERDLRRMQLLGGIDEISQIGQDEAAKLFELQKDRNEGLLRNEEEFAAAVAKVHEDAVNKRLKFERDANQRSLGSASQTFDTLAGLAANYAGKQSTAYRVMFGISKAFAVAQGTLAVGQSLAEAAKQPYPANIAAYLAAVAQGVQIMATIASASFEPGYDAGGFIPAGKRRIVGERGPEFVDGPATVTGRRETARQMAGSGDMRIYNVIDGSDLIRSLSGSRDFSPAIVNVIKANRNEIRRLLA